MITTRHIARMGRLVCSFMTPPEAPSYGSLFLRFNLPTGRNVLSTSVANVMIRCLVSESYVAIELLKMISNLALSDLNLAGDNMVLTAWVTAFEASDNGYGYR